MHTDDQVFLPIGSEWVGISPKLSAARRLAGAILATIPLIAAVVLFVLPAIPDWIGLATAGLTVVAYVWFWWFVGRRTASWKYSERTDDLLVKRGILFRRLVIVPYGRMQLVDLNAGPIDRAFGITRLQLHTAAATTDASIPGLLPEVAAGLRDRLAALGEERAAGL